MNDPDYIHDPITFFQKTPLTKEALESLKSTMKLIQQACSDKVIVISTPTTKSRSLYHRSRTGVGLSQTNIDEMFLIPREHNSEKEYTMTITSPRPAPGTNRGKLRTDLAMSIGTCLATAMAAEHTSTIHGAAEIDFGKLPTRAPNNPAYRDFLSTGKKGKRGKSY